MKHYQRRRSAVATRHAIEQIPSDAREQRARHLVAREHGQRLEAARADLQAAQEAHERAIALVPVAAEAVEAAKSALAAIETEPAFVNVLMAG